MGYRVRTKFFKNRWKIIIVILTLTVFYNEHFVYWCNSMWWPQLNCRETGVPCEKILIVSDPQILGPKNDLLNRFGFTDSDRYLKKSFYHAFTYIKPSVIIFLGDLIDEGSTSTNEEYDSYKSRFSYIFDTTETNLKLIYLPGDNDIGGEGNDHFTHSKLARFNENFPNQVENFSGQLHFISVNRISGDFNLPTISFEKGKYRIVLSHIPLTFVPGIFSQEVMTKLKPNVIFSAHDHRLAMATSRLNESDHFEIGDFSENNSKIVKKLNNYDCVEVIWPTCSYRMGVKKAGYGFATFGNDGNMEVGVLWTHSRFRSLYSYLIVCVFCLGFSLFPSI